MDVSVRASRRGTRRCWVAREDHEVRSRELEVDRLFALSRPALRSLGDWAQMGVQRGGGRHILTHDLGGPGAGRLRVRRAHPPCRSERSCERTRGATEVATSWSPPCRLAGDAGSGAPCGAPCWQRTSWRLRASGHPGLGARGRARSVGRPTQGRTRCHRATWPTAHRRAVARARQPRCVFRGVSPRHWPNDAAGRRCCDAGCSSVLSRHVHPAASRLRFPVIEAKRASVACPMVDRAAAGGRIRMGCGRRRGRAPWAPATA